MVMLAVGGGSDKCRRRAWEIQALAVACKRELGPEQRRHREEGGALEPVPMADADHGVSLPLTGTDATDPSQSLARPRAGAAQMWSARTVRRSTWQGEVHWPPPIPSSGSWPAPRPSGSAAGRTLGKERRRRSALRRRCRRMKTRGSVSCCIPGDWRHRSDSSRNQHTTDTARPGPNHGLTRDDNTLPGPNKEIA